MPGSIYCLLGAYATKRSDGLDSRYFITGASGNVGRYIVEGLEKESKEVLCAREPGGPCADFDFINSDTWMPCMDGVNKVFLMRPPHISNIRRDMEPFLRFLKEIEITQVVFMSVQGADKNRKIPHYDIEQACISLELPYTFIRPSFFMQNLSTTHLNEIRDDSNVFTPTGKGKTNFVDVRDIADVAIRLLVDEGHIRKAYTITGDISYSYGEIADHLSKGLGRRIDFADPGPLKFVIHSLKRGRKLGMTLVMLYLYSRVKSGKGDITTTETGEILGRPPRSIDAFILEQKHIFNGGV